MNIYKTNDRINVRGMGSHNPVTVICGPSSAGVYPVRLSGSRTAFIGQNEILEYVDSQGTVTKADVQVWRGYFEPAPALLA